MGYTSLKSSSRTSSTCETILRWGFLSNLTISSSSLDWVLVTSSTIRLGSFFTAIFVCCLIHGASGEENLTPRNSPSLLMFMLQGFWKKLLILLFQVKKLSLLSFLPWSFLQCDDLLFLKISISFQIKHFLSLKVFRNRSFYLNFDSPSKQFVW